MKTQNSFQQMMTNSIGLALKRIALGLAVGAAVVLGSELTAKAAPANDDFANAIELLGASGTQTGTDTIDATLEAGEPNPGATNTVWFKWTCPTNGTFTIGTLGSTDLGATEWDAIIGCFTGPAVGSLTVVVPPTDTVLEETLSNIPVTAGTTYYFQLAGWNNTVAANILLNYHLPATLHWDASGSGGLTDGAGTWDSGAYWWNGLTNVNWAGNNNAVIGSGGTGGPITVGTVTANQVTFTNFSGTYTLANGTLTAMNNLTVANSSGNVQINSAIAGLGGVTMNGSGTLTLAGANSYSGNTAVNAGTLVANGNTAVAGTTSFTVAGGATLLLSGTTGNAYVWPTASVTGAGTVRLPLGSGGNAGLNYNLSLFTGVLDLTNGMAALNPFYSPSFVSPTNGTIKLENNTTLYLGWQSFNLNSTVRLASGVDNGEGLGVLRGDTAQLDGAVILEANSTIGSAGGTFTINSVISDGGLGYGFSKVGGGTVILTTTNTYSGHTIVSAGTLECNNPGALGNGGLLSIGSSGPKANLNYTGTHVVPTLILGGIGRPAGIYGSTNSPAPATNQSAYFSGTGTITVNPPPIPGFPMLTWDANGTGAGLVDGGGSWLNPSNTWWNGLTNVNWAGTNNVVIGSGGTGGPITVGAVTAGQVTFTNFSGTYTLTNGALTVMNNLTVANSSGNVQINSAIAGLGGVTMNGSGTLTLAGTSTYAGQTLVSAGTLSFTAVAAEPSSGALVISNGAIVNLSDSGSSGNWPSVPVSGAGTLNVKLSGDEGMTFNYDMSGFTGILDIGAGGSPAGKVRPTPAFVSPTNGTIKIENNTTLYLGWYGFNLNSTVRLAGGTDNGEGLGVLRGDTAQVNGAVILMTNSTIGSAGGTFTINSVISDGGLGYGFSKVGVGTVVLTAANTYSGTTIVTGGTLKCNVATALSAGTLTINASGMVDLDYTGTQTISGLQVAGVYQPAGVYGGTASSATNQLAAFSTTGLGTVTVVPPPPVLPLSGFTIPGGQPTLTWHTAGGFRYRVVYTDTLTTPLASWLPVITTGFPGPNGWSTAISTGSDMTLVDPSPAAAHRFYRIEVQ